VHYKKMSTPESRGDKTQGVPSTSKSRGDMSPCPPTDLRPCLDQFRLFIRFCTDNRTVSLYFTMGRPFPLKIAPSQGDLDPSNTWFLELTRALNPNGTSIGAAIFAGLTSVTERSTERQTDRQVYCYRPTVTMGRIYLRSTTMWPNYGRPM